MSNLLLLGSGGSGAGGTEPEPPGFSPDDIAGLQLWLDAAEGTLWQDSARTTPAVADGDPVGAWDDESGNARHLLQATGSMRATLKLAIQNGLPVLRFDGVDDALMALYTLAQPIHVFLVINQITWTEHDRIFDGGAGNAMSCYDAGVSPTIGLYAGSGTAATNTGLTINTWHIMECLFSGPASSIVVDASTATNDYNPGTSTSAGFRLAGSAYGGSHGQIDVGEVCLYDSAISGADLTSLRDYLSAKWIPPSPPSDLLLESGDYALLESGEFILLE